MTFGEHVKRLRKQQYITQKDLSKMSGINNSLIAYYEQDKVIPNVYNAYDIACALGVTLDSMMR